MLQERNRLYQLHQEYKQCHETFARDAQRVQLLRLGALERLTQEVQQEKAAVAAFEVRFPVARRPFESRDGKREKEEIIGQDQRPWRTHSVVVHMRV